MGPPKNKSGSWAKELAQELTNEPSNKMDTFKLLQREVGEYDFNQILKCPKCGIVKSPFNHDGSVWYYPNKNYFMLHCLICNADWRYDLKSFNYSHSEIIYPDSDLQTILNHLNLKIDNFHLK